eukprot:gnl/Spiro4/5676_TR2900_c0_g1_i1.p1 gnl/Spiro4/5676_TR2900_c0_g1~~gnl/Spiro4/5676_TR2900_c0_g1_i1.p1  ORF type:complete len:355 (+),score=78.21 gnl/Spiro4/5676_TR2900_c0_g1_i1:30-1067(+)
MTTMPIKVLSFIIVVLFSSSASSTSIPPPTSRTTIPAPTSTTTTSWLCQTTRDILTGCLLVATDGTKIFTPDASASYGAQWTRDFAYAVEHAPALLQSMERAGTGVRVADAIRYTFKRQRADGCIPDRVTADGEGVFSPGNKMADHAIDNMPFAVKLVSSYAQNWNDSSLFCELLPAMASAMKFVYINPSSGLVYNDPAAPNCTYGFYDTVAASGDLLFVSLLMIDAASAAANLTRRFDCPNTPLYSTYFDSVVATISQGIDRLYDPSTGLFLAATVDNALPDLWGSALVVALNLSTAERRAGVVDYFASGSNAGIFQNGQLRHLPPPLAWQKCFQGACPQLGTY